MPDTTITTRWINLWEASKEEITEIDFLVESRGEMKLNLNTSRVLIAERESRIVGFAVFQLVPHIEPLWVDESLRGTGLAAELADEVFKFIHAEKVRGAIAIADNPAVEALCKAHDMRVVTSPVYVYVGRY